MKIKSAALFLVIASFMWLVELLYFTYERIFGESAKYYRDKPVEMILSTMMVAVPVAFLIFSFAVYNKKPKPAPTPLADEGRQAGLLDVEIPNLTMGNWIGIFFISIIPVVGIIFLIKWAMDNNNPIRKNWAAASLVWLVFQVIIVFIGFSVFFGRLYRY